MRQHPNAKLTFAGRLLLAQRVMQADRSSRPNRCPAQTPARLVRRVERLASSLEAENPGAAASGREGLEETLTLHRLGISGALYRTLRSTNPIENLNGSVAEYTRNVKR